MMENRATLQFILDTVQKIGGAPHNLEKVQEEALDPGNIYTMAAIYRVTLTTGYSGICMYNTCNYGIKNVYCICTCAKIWAPYVCVLHIPLWD